MARVSRWVALMLLVSVVGFVAGCRKPKGSVTLRNVSYDPTRELYLDFNKAFVAYYKDKTGLTVDVQQSHGGSGKQSRAVIDGLDADVVTLALGYDIDVLHEQGNLVPENWQSRLPNNASPYTSTIVFLVRKGNPKGIKDWEDLTRDNIEVIVPNPKSSGGARWAYLAGWGHALRKSGGDQAAANAYITSLYKHVPVLDKGARDSTVTFTQRGVGDVLLAWENEAILARNTGKDQYEIVVPSESILAEPPVSVVDKVVDKKGTRAAAEEYLKYLYTPQGQEIAARNFYRPRSAEVAAKYEKQFPKITLFTIEEVAGPWKQAQATHFADGGIFDQIYKPTK